MLSVSQKLSYRGGTLVQVSGRNKKIKYWEKKLITFLTKLQYYLQSLRQLEEEEVGKVSRRLRPDND